MALSDPRALTVQAFLQWVIDGAGTDSDFEAICYGEIGAAYALHRMRTRQAAAEMGRSDSDAWVQVRARLMAQQRRIEAAQRAAHDALADLKIPSTHWSFDPPGHVKVLIGSRPVRFPVYPVEDLPLKILGHPRAQFLARAG